MAIRFSPTALGELDQVEQDTVAQEVAAGIVLRNKDLISMPLRSEALDAVIDTPEQIAWLNEEEGSIIPSDRADLARQRRNSTVVPDRLFAHPAYADVVKALAYYVGVCLPRPDLIEQRFWSVSNMPSTGKSSTWHRLAVISVNNVETLVIGEYREVPTDPWIPFGFINTILTTPTPDWAHDICDIGNYRSTGDVKSFAFAESYLDVIDLLGDDDIFQGARDLALGLCRKGAGMMARYHDYALADEISIQIDNWNNGTDERPD